MEWKSNSLAFLFVVLRRAGVALLVSSLYCMLSWPCALSGVNAPDVAELTYLLAEAMICALVALLLWFCCELGLAYKIPLLSRLGRGYVVTAVVVGVSAALLVCMIVAELTGILDKLVAVLPLKAFCLSALYSVAALCGVVKSLKRVDDEEESLPAETISSVTISSVTIKSGSEIAIVDVANIVYLKAEGDYVSIVTPSGRHLKEQTMKYFESSLPGDKFVRVHRSYIINTSYLRSIERYGDYQMVLMAGGEKIRISAARYKVLKEKLGL